MIVLGALHIFSATIDSHMRFLLILVAFIGASTFPVIAQQQEIRSPFTFFPGRLLSPPLIASLQEPRVGFCKDVNTSRLKVDIGASVDVLEFRPAGDSLQRMRVGIDFFTYALSTNSEGLRLQIDAVDGFFGGHVAYINQLTDTRRLTLRLRLLHLSAHFLDGHFNNVTQTWKDGRAPIPFTRDFGELLGIYDHPYGTLYAGLSYATLVRPTQIRRVEFHGGIELHAANIASVFGKPFNLYLAHHITARGIPSYIGTNNTEAGVKFGERKGGGLRIYVAYYAGLDIFSQYFDVRRNDFGAGMAFDFW